MRYSHSMVDCFEKCPFKFKLSYLDRIKCIPSTDANNALIIGSALHKGLEYDAETAIQEYMEAFPIITDDHIHEIIKLEYLIPRMKQIIPDGEFEVEIQDDDFHGFIDLLAPVGENEYDIYDFKYSNNSKYYVHSNQLHLYKYFFEKCNPTKKIRSLNFLFIPKVNIKLKKTETLHEFRERINQELEKGIPKIVPIVFDYEKVIDFLLQIKKINEEEDYAKNPQFLCDYCDYQNYCIKGDEYMLLPSKERRSIEKVNRRTIWIYGSPFTGKTTFANAFPDPLMLNTDGNIKFVDAPYIHIKDEITVEGRTSNKKFAWEIFREVITELEKNANDFKTIVVDLLEDMYEHCRVYMYDQLGIKHESDDSFKAWDMIRSEYLNTLKRLMNLNYENIVLISHEDTSKDITRKGGDKITSIKPNIQDKVANKIAGMVDIVARIVADGDVRTFNFKSNEVVFGGGRLKVNMKDIPLDVKTLFDVYDEANAQAVKTIKAREVKADKVPTTVPTAPSAEIVTKSEIEIPTVSESKPEDDTPPFDVDTPPAPEAEAPKTRARKRRSA